MNKRENYYRKCKLHTLEIGEEFVFNGTDFKLIYKEHAICVGLTVEKFEHQGRKAQQVLSFADKETVLVLIKNPIENG